MQGQEEGHMSPAPSAGHIEMTKINDQTLAVALSGGGRMILSKSLSLSPGFRTCKGRC